MYYFTRETVLYICLVNEQLQLQLCIWVGQVSHTALANVEVWEWREKSGVSALLSSIELAGIFQIRKQNRTPTGI